MLRTSKGITLIELMVVVVIVAIVAAVALPSYRQYTIRANRTEGKVALLQVAQALEKCFTRFHAYDHEDCDADVDFETAEGHYAIAAPARDATSYTLTATPQGGQSKDLVCGTLSINEMGERFESGTGDVGDCW